MKKVLITGGAGYKGVLLAETLLKEGYFVTILDNFMYGFESVLGFAGKKNCGIIKKDIRNLQKEDVKDHDLICHLAAISGYPACEANPHSAKTINVDSTERLVNLLGEEQILVYASTTSMYGKSDKVQDESSQPHPLSLYAVTKYEAEKICMQRKNSISLRFATLFGVSRKMRCDLLLNDFVYKAVTERSIVLFDSHSVRTFLHIRDAIKAYIMATQQPEKFVDKIFNVGSKEMNYSKLDLAQRINNHCNIEIIETNLSDPDRRSFIMNFDKISSLGFSPNITLDEGIQELLRLYDWYRPFITYKTI